MQFRTIKQFVIHLETFRNIQLWYQGIYYLKFSIYAQYSKQKKIYAHPFALTQCNLAQKDINSHLYDSQIVSHSYINQAQSAYYSKAFHLKYFEQQVQINDLCHFRIEVNTFDQQNINFTMQIGLWFYDSFKKDAHQSKKFKQQSKQIRNIKFVINPFVNSQSIHQYVPALFEDQYFSLTNLVMHTINIDHRIRMNQLQLSQFAKLSEIEKRDLLQRLKNQKNKKSTSISQYLRKQMKLDTDKKVLQSIMNLLKEQILCNTNLLKEYQKIFQFSITQNEVKYFSQHLIYPNQIETLTSIDSDEILKQQSELILKNNSQNVKIQSLEDRIIAVLNKLNYVGAKNLKLWEAFIKLLKINPRFSVAFYEKDFKINQQKFWKQLVRVDKISNIDITSSYNQNLNHLIKQLQKTKNQLIFQTKIYDYRLVLKKASLPLIIFQQFDDKQSMILQKQIKNQKLINDCFKKGFQGVHLVILVHGFQGTSYDMKNIKNNISYLFPQSMFLCCTANEDLTDNGIFQMGNRIASQIKSFIIQNFPNNTLGRISFIGHSLGGLKIRAALPKLLEYKEKFHCFISFSSPHLGYKVNTSSVIQAGIWILQKMKQSQCLKELTMTDNTDPFQTTLYKLSLQEGLQYFKKIILYSSGQDSYAPYESARVEIDPGFMGSNDPLKNIHCQMVQNILKSIRRQVLHRVHVNFTISTTNLDSLIGRTAHIMFLQTSQVVKGLTFTNQKLFS